MALPQSSHDLAAFLDTWKAEIVHKSRKRPIPGPKSVKFVPAVPTVFSANEAVITTHTYMGTQVSPAAFFGTTPAKFNFACLPAEVRINIYLEIFRANAPPSTSVLEDHMALIRSNKHVKSEFIFECAKLLVDNVNAMLGTPTGVRVSGFDGTQQIRILYSGAAPMH
jgi:hypothetical protein